ncbi:APC family permease [Cetobacterium sp.]|uniref:APC family permease n=1 Tax=Cetobacterium sp. TaxID=2071632 RepID=UPI002FC8177E
MAESVQVLENIGEETIKLDRVLGKKELMAAAVGQIIGAGIFSLLPQAIGLTGKGAAIAFIIAAIITIFGLIPRIFANGTIRMNGGNYTHLALFGGRKLAGAFLIINIITNVSLSMYALSFAEYFCSSIDGFNIRIVACICLTMVTILNIIGVKSAAKLQTILVLVLASAIALFCAFGVFKIQPNYIQTGGFTPDGIGGIMGAAALLTFATGGATTIINFSAEAKNPTKDIPMVMIISTICVAVMYAIMAVIATGVLPLETVANKPLNLVAAEILPGPLYVFFIVGGAMFALLTTLNSQLGWCTKPLIQGCIDGWLPKWMGKINSKYKTPHNLIIFFYLVGLLPILFNVNMRALSGTAVFSSKIIDLIIAYTLIKLPKVIPNEWRASRYYVSETKLKIGVALSVGAALLAAYLSLRTMNLNAIITNLVTLGIAVSFGYYVDKSGNVDIKVSYEKE